jgi:EsV-1-7 cysteine-rich motif
MAQCKTCKENAKKTKSKKAKIGTAVFNIPSVPRLPPQYCKDHKTDDMINVKHTKCIGPNCGKIAKFEGPYCKKCYMAAHSGEKPTRTDVKLCQENGCPTQPCFNAPNETVPIYCKKHAKKNLAEYVNLVTKRCEHGRARSACAECKGANRCAAHNKMKDTCKECKGPGICEHGIRRYFCRECKGKGTCEHKGDRRACNICNGTRVCGLCCDRRGNRRYNLGKKQICAECFWNNLDELTKGKTAEEINALLKKPRYAKMKEVCITQDIKNMKMFPDGTWNYQEHVRLLDSKASASRYYIDLDWNVNMKLKIALEIDEEQHRWTSCDLRRSFDIVACYGQHIVFVRFNPDSYKNTSGQKVQGMFTEDRKKTQVYEKRMQDLAQLVKTYSERVVEGKPLLHVVFVNYDHNATVIRETIDVIGKDQVEMFQF